METSLRGILPEAIRMRRDKGGAFDPGIMSRIVAGRAALSAWASTDRDRPCWRYIDRSRYLAALAEVSSAPRAQWRQDTFNIVLMGGLIARFIDWHHDWHHDTAREVQ